MSRAKRTVKTTKEITNRRKKERERKRFARQKNKRLQQVNSPNISKRLNMEAFSYKTDYDYSKHKNVQIGKMNIICAFCKAKKFINESIGICCLNGKIKLPYLPVPPKPLNDFMSGNNPTSRNFLRNIRKYNTSFQMTSFGATQILNDHQYLPTFKIQGQIYHLIGSLLPLDTQQTSFLQIYFMGDENTELNQRASIVGDIDRDILKNLQTFLHKHNLLIRMFQTSLENMPKEE